MRNFCLANPLHSTGITTLYLNFMLFGRAKIHVEIFLRRYCLFCGSNKARIGLRFARKVFEDNSRLHLLDQRLGGTKDAS